MVKLTDAQRGDATWGRNVGTQRGDATWGQRGQRGDGQRGEQRGDGCV